MNSLEFGHAVRRAAPVFASLAGRMRKEAENGALADLVQILRANRSEPLSLDDTGYLADLLSGLLSPAPGRPSLKYDQRNWRMEVCRRTYERARGSGITFGAAATLEEAALKNDKDATKVRWKRATATEIEKWAHALSPEERKKVKGD